MARRRDRGGARGRGGAWAHARAWALVTVGAAGVLAGCAADGARSTRGAIADERVRGASPEGISGMVLIRDGVYLVVHDRKEASRARAAILRVGDWDQRRYQEVRLHDGALPGGPMADIESVCAVPGRASEFLLLESGASDEGHGRRRILAHARLSEDEPAELRVLGWEDVRDITAPLTNCESVVCWSRGGRLGVLIADRGRMEGGRGEARVVAGALELADGEHAVGGGLRMKPAAPASDGEGAIRLELGAEGAWRACSDLYLDDRGVLWGACAQDPGDRGPFRSKVYSMDITFEPDGRVRLGKGQVRYEIDGLKVEAIAECGVKGSGLAVGSDDEDYGGVWRPLPVLSGAATDPGR